VKEMLPNYNVHAEAGLMKEFVYKKKLDR